MNLDQLAEAMGVASPPRVTIDYDGPDGIIGIVDDETGDIIGSGDTEQEAIADAIETARRWSK
jgi:hypothetical protein